MITNTLLDNPVVWAEELHKKPESYWIHRGEAMGLRLFREMSIHVPAYKQMIREKQIRPETIRTAKNFSSIPICSKQSYLNKYPLKQLNWTGKHAIRQQTIAATSGSTGVPFYFPRSIVQDKQYAAIAEMYLRTNFQIHKKSTLYIVGWGMGVWIGGVFSYTAVRMVALRGKYDLSLITPGTSKKEIISAVTQLGRQFDQIIIGGYPPMVKDLLSEGEEQGVKWKTYPLKFIFSAEGFSEDFRDYIVDHAGLQNVYMDTLNHYGTVDLGTMAHETPLTILIRRLAHNNPALNKSLFGESYRQPTLAQYIPELFYFEEVEGQLVCSAYSGLPLVRYALLDMGGVLTMDTVRTKAQACGIDIEKEIQNAHIEGTIWNIPFVYLFERADFTVKLYGANIYPQEIRRALEQKEITGVVTGKCTMQIMYDKQMNQCLAIHIETKPKKRISSAVAKRIRTYIIEELLAHNSEYAYLYTHIKKENIEPHIMIHPYQSPGLFDANGKHRWVRKEP